MTKLSVVIPCFNLGAFLDEAIDSVLVQNFPECEIIVVDDGSNDPATCRHLDGFAPPGTVLIRTDNRGVAAARNAGIAAASGKYILPLDADDRIAPGYLARAVSILDRNQQIGIVYCNAELFGELQGEWLVPEFSLPHMLLDNLIFSAAMFRRCDWETVGGYDETMRIGWEDWDFWLRLLEQGKEVYRLPEVYFHYRIRKGSRERSLGLLEKIRLMAGLLTRHRRLYAQQARALATILLTGTRKRPGLIRV